MVTRKIDHFRDSLFKVSRMQYLLVFFGEMLGQGLFAFMNINIINQIASTDSVVYKVILTSIFYTCSMFMNISYGREFTGGVYNPAVVLFRMLRRTDRYPFGLGCLYLFS